MRSKSFLAAVLAVSALAMPLRAMACDDPIDDDHDLARDLYEGGRIRSLSEILHIVRAQAPGEVVGVNLDCLADRWTYRLQVVDGRGHRTIVVVDASAGTILQDSEKE